MALPPYCSADISTFDFVHGILRVPSQFVWYRAYDPALSQLPELGDSSRKRCTHARHATWLQPHATAARSERFVRPQQIAQSGSAGEAMVASRRRGGRRGNRSYRECGGNRG